ATNVKYAQVPDEDISPVRATNVKYAQVPDEDSLTILSEIKDSFYQDLKTKEINASRYAA
uniref:hypothetical protein n=1 Tax=Acinetobacter sp. GG2 TaxID=651305 RepID=UPI0004A46D0D